MVRVDLRVANWHTNLSVPRNLPTHGLDSKGVSMNRNGHSALGVEACALQYCLGSSTTVALELEGGAQNPLPHYKKNILIGSQS